MSVAEDRNYDAFEITPHKLHVIDAKKLERSAMSTQQYAWDARRETRRNHEKRGEVSGK